MSGPRFPKGAWFVLAAALSSVVTWTAVARVVSASHATRAATGMDFEERLRPWQQEMRADPSKHRVALVGDSMLFPGPRSPGVAERLSVALEGKRSSARRASVHALGWPAWTTIGEYCVLDEIIATKPDVVALEVNLHALEPRSLGVFGVPELASFIKPRRLVEAAFLPMSDAGLTLNRLLFYRAVRSLHLVSAWDTLVDRQARLMNARGPIEHGLARYVGGTTAADATQKQPDDGPFVVVRDGEHRASRDLTRLLMGTVMHGMTPDSPRLRVLAAILDRLHDEKLRTLVWVSPINVEYLAALGFANDGLARSLDAIRGLVEARGATFADFHGLLPDASFRDAGDHYTLDGEKSGAAEVARRLSRSVSRLLAGTRERPLP